MTLSMIFFDLPGKFTELVEKPVLFCLFVFFLIGIVERSSGSQSMGFDPFGDYISDTCIMIHNRKITFMR